MKARMVRWSLILSGTVAATILLRAYFRSHPVVPAVVPAGEGEEFIGI